MLSPHFMLSVLQFTAIYIVYLLTYFIVSVVLIVLPFNFYTRITSDLPTTVIAIQYSVFVYIFNFTNKFYIFTCYHVASFHFNLNSL